MKIKWTPHMIAATAFVVFIALGLACASTPEEIAEREAKKKAEQEAKEEALRQYFLKYDEYAVGAIGADAVYWKNREVFKLPRVGVGAAGEIATSIVVSGNDVYIAGEILYSGSTYEAVYWKNNQPVTLPRGNARISEATSIVISGNDVYVTGRADDDAVYWKNNGQPVILPRLNAKAAVAKSITILGNDAYVAGFLDVGGSTQAVYWRGNGQPVTLRSGPGAVAEAIAISGNNVYVAGWVGDNAVLWTNGQLAILPGDAKTEKWPYTYESGGFTRANSIFILGSDVYIGGYANFIVTQKTYIAATHWKNGERINYNYFDSGSYGYSIFVLDDPVTTIVGGYYRQEIIDTGIPLVSQVVGERNIATLWINGIPTFIGPHDKVMISSKPSARGGYDRVADPENMIDSVIRDIYVVKK